MLGTQCPESCTLLWNLIRSHKYSRINYDVACSMDFHRFPVDEQYCEVKFESFGFTNKQVSQTSVQLLVIQGQDFPDQHEVDGADTVQCEQEHLPGPVLLHRLLNGLLQHRLLRHCLPGPYHEGDHLSGIFTQDQHKHHSIYFKFNCARLCVSAAPDQADRIPCSADLYTLCCLCGEYLS